MKTMNSWTKDIILLTLLIGLAIGATLGKYPLSAPDGARYAEIPREMVVTGDYLTPHLNGIKYFEKPPLFYWMQATSLKVFGINQFAATFANALMILLSALCIYITSRKIFGRLQGLTSSFIFITMSLVFALSRIVTLDVALTFFITASLCSFLLATKLPIGTKRSLHLWAMYIFAACAVMTKGLVGAGFLGIIVAIWLTIYGEWRNIKNYNLISGIFIFLLIALPWHILAQMKNPEFLYFYFIDQHFLRYFTDTAQRSKKWWFFPAVSLGGMYPWLVFLPQTITNTLAKIFKKLKESKSTVFLFLWIAVIYTIYSFSNSKLIPYLLPIFPPIAILMGNYLSSYWQDSKKARPIKTGFNVLFALNIAMGIAAFAVTFFLDFNEHALTKVNLYVAGTVVTIGAFVNLISYYRGGLKAGFIALTLSTVILYLCIDPVITIINRQSIKPLITVIQENIKPGDEVMAYGNYYQDLPFYLERIVTVVGFRGELGFGVDNQPSSKEWMIDEKEFWKRWNSDKTVYVIAREDFYKHIKSASPNKTKVLKTLWDTLLLTNKKEQ